MYLTKVKSIKKLGVKRSFDLIVKDCNHNFFLSNGLLSHNSGKSTLARTMARYCCPWFDTNYIAFTAEEFIRITNEAPEYSSVVLDESFESFNTRTSMTPEFTRIVNHLQLIRQRHLFLFFCLPNFFDLTKGIAIFRSSHLFVTHADEEGNRGRFIAFGRDTKRVLYVKGSKYLDYNCVKGNFHGKFYRNKAILDEKVYDQMKIDHLKGQAPKEKEQRFNRDEWVKRLKSDFGFDTAMLCRLSGLSDRQIRRITQDVPQNQASDSASSLFNTDSSKNDGKKEPKAQDNEQKQEVLSNAKRFEHEKPLNNSPPTAQVPPKQQLITGRTVNHVDLWKIFPKGTGNPVKKIDPTDKANKKNSPNG